MLSDAMTKSRDKRLRRQLLYVLYLCRESPQGGANGRTVTGTVAEDLDEEMGFESDEHAVQLIRDLALKGLLTEEKLARRRTERFGPQHLFLRITDKGSMLLREEIPIDPDVYDERIED